MQGNASPQVGTTSYLVIDTAIGTYPNYITQAGTTTTFTAATPNVITVTSWPLTAQETKILYGQSFWMVDLVNGKLAFGKWQIINTNTLIFNCTEGFPKWDTNVSTGLASGIPDRDVRHFDQCSVRSTGAGEVTVNGYPVPTGQWINIIREGNAQFPVIIDATDGIARINTALI